MKLRSGLIPGAVLQALAALLVLALRSGGEEPAKPGLAGGPPTAVNPLLVDQQPGTWLRLPIKSKIKPTRIHTHAGGVIDPETSIVYFFGSDSHGVDKNNDVWSYNPVAMTWQQSYPIDPFDTYRYQDGRKTTTTGHPWAMHTFAMNTWDPVGKQLVVGAWQMHYGFEHLPQVRIPPDATESWWHYDPVTKTWAPALNSPNLGLGHLCYVPRLQRIVGFDGRNVPVTIYDPAQKVFQAFAGFQGRTPAGYTLRSAYDTKRDRILLLSWDSGSNVWAFDLEKRQWTNLQVKHRPAGNIYGSWDYDQSADIIVSLWPADPEGGFHNTSGASRTFLVDLHAKAYQEVKTEPAAPYTGMSYRVLYDPRHKVTFAVQDDEVWSFKAPVRKSSPSQRSSTRR